MEQAASASPRMTRQVVGTVSGRVVFRNVTVQSTPPAKGCFKQGLFSSLKPSFEKTFNFAKERLLKEKSVSSEREIRSANFGSTPAVNFIDCDKMASSCHSAVDFGGALSRSETKLHRLSTEHKGSKYALVKLHRDPVSVEMPIDKVRVSGRDVHHRASSIEDGLGVLATTTNDLIGYERTPHRYQSMRSQSDYEEATFVPPGSQFTPPPNWRSTPGSGRAAVVRPGQRAQRCFSTINEHDMRGRSVERQHAVRVSHSVNSDFNTKAHLHQSLNDLNSSVHSFNTGGQYSTRKPTSVVELPTAARVTTTSQPINGFLNDRDSGSDGGTTTMSEFSPERVSTPISLRRQSAVSNLTPWVEATTFGTDPNHISSNYCDAIFSADQVQVSSSRHSGVNHGSVWEDDPRDYSPMSSNSGNSAATATTLSTNGSTMPAIFNQNGSKQIAVPPWPQKKPHPSHRSSGKEDPRQRMRAPPAAPSPYQVGTSPGYAIPPKAPHRSHRFSSEVFIDGPMITAGGDGNGVRVSQLEERVRDLEILNESIRSTASRQNLMFSEPKSDMQRQMGQELIDKSVFIGQLESRIRIMAANIEKKQVELDDANTQLKKEKDESRNKYLTMREKINALTEQLNACERAKDDKSEKQLAIVNEQLKLRDSELTALKAQSKKKDEEERRLQARIRELENTVNSLQKAIANAGSSTTRTYAGKQVETLSEWDSESEVAFDMARSNCTTPVPQKGSSSSSSVVVEVKALPAVFEHLLRKHYHRTMSCHALALGLSQATLHMLDGKDSDAVKALGFITDTEGEESDAFVSDASDACKMNLAMAERFLRKECDLLDRTEKKLTDVRKGYLGILGKDKAVADLLASHRRR